MVQEADTLKEAEIKRVFANPPRIETPRLLLRKITLGDYMDMYDYARDPEVPRYLIWDPHPNADYTYRYVKTLDKQYKAGEFFDWGVCIKTGGSSENTGDFRIKRIFLTRKSGGRTPNTRFIGTCGFTSFDFNNLSAEIGYVFHRDMWGQGIAGEAVSAVMDFGFRKIGLNRIEARYMVENQNSRRVMEKCGMSFEGIHRRSMLIKGEFRDIGVFSILRDEYMNILNEGKVSYSEF